ncbi:hypothetical protein PC129_g20007 [Phytophthora cactorum]|uniref:Uncharacterized protein n=2 Tax=Phytophthora cactorum TaxID=29920 RepID=A0A8T1H9S6_9STRA|nr:hypothetical protein Pcac1_g12161 [Phytophthora cactorum]KAG2799083.1 hypothetical protein PC111_g20570 [Phytophthora cactorum]KAG2799141.1 hypothetical protein PC112_g21043 [Phytophthora cactorum]KAG2849520.1 hypothetical protein PC113_g17400 [Phytophthora cactorum]KAG2878154.1 hypothetical protein PC114_g23271 [Phytophthora cactorum]
MIKGKRAGAICTFPQCNTTMTTSKFKQHFEQHLLEGEAYDITHRERYERALNDPSLLPGDGPCNPFLVAKLRAVLAHLQGLDVRMQGIEGHSSASSDDEDIGMNTTEFLAQERPMEAPAVADDVARRTRRAHGRVLRTLSNLS